MTSRLMRTTLAFGALLATFANARGEDAAVEAEFKKLDGEWTVLSMAGGGDVVYRFKGKKLEIEAPSRSYTMTIKLDPKSKPDKTIDFKIDEAPEDAKGKTSKGIYKFEDDETLILCFSGEGDRPAKFEQNGFEQILTKLKRKKKAIDKPETKKSAPTVKTVTPKAADADAPLPVGWPDGTAPGKIEVKKYPAYRSAIARAKGATVKNDTVLFFFLFNHIQRKGVEMTAPVVMTYEPQVIEQEGGRGNVSMEFLYRRPDQGEAGPGVGAVKVEDFPATEFVCLGSQGKMDDNTLRAGVATLREWLEEHKDEWVASGPPRRLGYHGPMTPIARQLNEIQIPVKPAH